MAEPAPEKRWNWLCCMPTKRGLLCKHKARVLYVRDKANVHDEVVAEVTAAYCQQHEASTNGRCRMLRPRPWEYDRKVVLP